MIKKLFFLLVFLAGSSLWSAPITLKDKLLQSNAGDYIVTNQRKIYSLLAIHKKSDTSLILEEISLPENSYKKQRIQSWKDWVLQGAPGHSMWMMYEIDLKKGAIQSIYSPSEKKHFQASGDELFFAKLLTLPLLPIPLEERRKIGPPPLEGEKDTRLLWNPSLFIEGKKNSAATFSAFRATYPIDGSELSGKIIDLYFADTSLCFPIWIQVQTGHYTVMLHSVDSGFGLNSPATFLPAIFPKFEKSILNTSKELVLTMSHLEEVYYPGEYFLYAVDITNPEEKRFHRIPFTLQREQTQVTFKIQKEQVESILVKEHRYVWVFHPQNFPDLFVDHPEIFTW